jgi:hypothetical protein
MNSCQGLLRALESKYYKQLALSTSTGWNKKVEEFNRSVDDVSTAIKETEPTRTALARFLPDKLILENDLLSKLARKSLRHIIKGKNPHIAHSCQLSPMRLRREFASLLLSASALRDDGQAINTGEMIPIMRN